MQLSFKSIFAYTLSLLLFVFLSHSYSQENKNKEFFVGCVAFYNVENLFDTINQPNNDEEFLPEGKNQWNTDKYLRKLDYLSQVLSQLGTEVTPDGAAIIGLSEIENREVLEALVKTPALKKFNYEVVHYNSPDKRGVDVALLYQPKYFKLTGSKSFTLTIEGMDNFFTRDQLLVSGLFDGERMHFIVNHWPSRRGGEKRSAPLRNAAAQLSRKIIDSLLAADANAKIILMGDLNDDPVDESMKNYLRAKGKAEEMKNGDLFNPMYSLYEKGIGTLSWNDAWNLFDQFVLTPAFLKKDFSGYRFYAAKVFNKPFVLHAEGKYKGTPFRTFEGGGYAGGYSDHLAVYLFLTKEKK